MTRECDQLPVRTKGCVNEAFGVKYLSMALCWVEGGDWVRRWMTWGISATGSSMVMESVEFRACNVQDNFCGC